MLLTDNSIIEMNVNRKKKVLSKKYFQVRNSKRQFQLDLLKLVADNLNEFHLEQKYNISGTIDKIVILNQLSIYRSN